MTNRWSAPVCIILQTYDQISESSTSFLERLLGPRYHLLRVFQDLLLCMGFSANKSETDDH